MAIKQSGKLNHKGNFLSLPFAFASNSSIYGEEEKCIISEKRLFFSFSFKGLVRLALQDSFLQQSNCEMNFFCGAPFS